ncbi:hypothetical protein RGQ29_011356 [Quercus rubra]|uniref:ABC transporter domain-containing protein n=1 Tax=Quercus rubra TaxID=3512 RepID=A0AAN7J8Q3_QUERU|nr:hypothetical protein RGQ29_011356 [Quercus rubra]
MGKKPEGTGAKASGKDSSKDAKKGKLSVSAMLANMDEKPKKGSSSNASSKPKTKAPKVSSYTDDIDLPPFDDEDDASEEDLSDAKKRQMRNDSNSLDIAITEQAKREALRDDHDAFTVVIRSRASVLDGDNEADANVKDITVDKFSISARGKELLKNMSSTLLKLLAWRKIPVPKNIDVLLVEQEVVGDDKTALEAVVSAKEVLASKILAGLGFTKDMQGRPTRSFSGGWRMRISLARALFVQPTLLLLDEPTNHLDLRAVLCLEEYLCRWKKTLVVVSHDRDFLNTVCTEIIHLHDFKLHFYRGNFDDFESGYEQHRKEMNKKFETYEKQIKAAKRSRSRAQQEKVKDRAKFNATKEASKSKAKGKVDKDEPLPEAPKKWRDYSVEFHFLEPTELTPPLLQLIEVSFSYPNQADFRLSNVDVGIDMGTRVAIVGPNGAGKSTLLNLLAGDFVPTEGEVRRSQKLRIGRYSQHFVNLLTMVETPVQYLLRLHPDQEGLSKQEAIRAKLGKFGLPRQKSRVVFTSISMSKPHILLLDEPTNQCKTENMQSIDALANALDEFTGGVILVSHDSRLISHVCEDEEKSEIWVVENGTARNFPGTFEEYKEELQREIKSEVDE